jgi:hypothetical protein
MVLLHSTFTRMLSCYVGKPGSKATHALSVVVIKISNPSRLACVLLFCHLLWYSRSTHLSLCISLWSNLLHIIIPWYIIFDGTRLLACKFYCLISSKVVLSSNFKMNKSYPIGFLHMKYLRSGPNKLYL